MPMRSNALNDRNYDMISVLYHLLQSADTLDKYCADAENANDSELAAFFRELQENNNQMAKRAQHLLKTRLQ